MSFGPWEDCPGESADVCMPEVLDMLYQCDHRSLSLQGERECCLTQVSRRVKSLQDGKREGVG